MDYSKLWSLINQAELSKSAAGRIAGLSPQGFITMMERETMTVSTLETFARYFKKPISYFFEESIGFNDTDEKKIEYDKVKLLEKRVRLLEDYFEIMKLSENMREFQEKLEKKLISEKTE